MSPAEYRLPSAAAFLISSSRMRPLGADTPALQLTTGDAENVVTRRVVWSWGRLMLTRYLAFARLAAVFCVRIVSATPIGAVAARVHAAPAAHVHAVPVMRPLAPLPFVPSCAHLRRLDPWTHRTRYASIGAAAAHVHAAPATRPSTPLLHVCTPHPLLPHGGAAARVSLLRALLPPECATHSPLPFRSAVAPGGSPSPRGERDAASQAKTEEPDKGKKPARPLSSNPKAIFIIVGPPRRDNEKPTTMCIHSDDWSLWQQSFDVYYLEIDIEKIVSVKL
ncbi:hypothetical protein DFH06DRAFT_1150417 [Mycena polygramma]|nr:hypothetical protein DFH06DRAFT_1150417 [Mycena polygramma]